jgi:hypothetical protein
MLCCQAEGVAAKGLVTCQSPHIPESLTTRLGGIEEKSEHRVLRVSTAIHQQSYLMGVLGDTIPVPTVARVHVLSPKLWYNTTSFGCHAFLLANFWYLHTTIF